MTEVEYIHNSMVNLINQDQPKYRFLGSGYGTYKDNSKLEITIGASPEKGSKYVQVLIDDFIKGEDDNQYKFKINPLPKDCKTVECNHEKYLKFKDHNRQ